MKRLFTLLAIVAVAGLTLSCGGNATKKNDGAVKKEAAPEREGYHDDYLGSSLYGDVESVTIRTYSEIVKGELNSWEKYTFNQHGDVVEHTLYNSDGRLNGKTIYKYDSAGNMIEKAYYSDGSLHGKILYKYDSAGNKIEEAMYASDGRLLEKDLCKYDSAGNMIEWAEYNSDGRLLEKDLCKYDSAGNMIEEAIYNSDGSLDYKAIYKYDSRGNIVENTCQGEMIPVKLIECEIIYRE